MTGKQGWPFMKEAWPRRLRISHHRCAQAGAGWGGGSGGGHRRAPPDVHDHQGDEGLGGAPAEHVLAYSCSRNSPQGVAAVSVSLQLQQGFCMGMVAAVGRGSRGSAWGWLQL